MQRAKCRGESKRIVFVFNSETIRKQFAILCF
nr:MAG TPA: hypothetical protein [Caudoviricetes sp.]